MVAVGLLGLGFAALRSGEASWSLGIYSCVVLALLTAIPLARYRPGRSGAFWFGFAAFGWGYLLAGLGIPGEGYDLMTSMGTPAPGLITTYWINEFAFCLDGRGWLGWIRLPIHPLIPDEPEVERISSLTWIIQFYVTLLFAWLGGGLTMWIAAKERRAEASVPSEVAGHPDLEGELR
jgi:hypothetical protein